MKGPSLPPIIYGFAIGVAVVVALAFCASEENSEAFVAVAFAAFVATCGSLICAEREPPTKR